MTNKQLKPSLVFIRIRSTMYWDQKFIEESQIEDIWDVYLYDETSHTHLCEFTPSYCLHYVDTHAFFKEGVEEEHRNEAEDEVMTSAAQNEMVSYYHVAVIKGIDEKHKDRDNEILDDEEWKEDQQYRELIDAFIEGYRGNPTFA